MTVLPGPTDVPGPGAPGSPPPADPPTLTGDQIAELTAIGAYALDRPSLNLHTRPDRNPVRDRDLNSDSFIDTAFQFVSDLVGLILGPIKAIASWIWEGVKDAAQWAWDFASDIWNTVTDVFSKLFDAITNGISEIFGFVTDLLAQALSWAETAFNWVVDKGAWLLDQIGQLAELVANAIASSIGWIWDNLIQPVTDLIGSLFGDLWDAFWAAADWVWEKVQQIAEAVVNAVLDAASWVWDKVRTIATDVFNALWDALGFAWDVLREAWKWIEYFATHPFSWFGDWLTDIEGFSARIFGPGIFHALQNDGDVIESVVARMLGG